MAHFLYFINYFLFFCLVFVLFCLVLLTHSIQFEIVYVYFGFVSLFWCSFILINLFSHENYFLYFCFCGFSRFVSAICTRSKCNFITIFIYSIHIDSHIQHISTYYSFCLRKTTIIWFAFSRTFKHSIRGIGIHI